MALLDSRVTIGAAAFAISRVLGASLGYIIGSNISPGYCIATQVTTAWLTDLLNGDPRKFDLVVEASGMKKLPAKWLRFLLLLGGDIERKPGPARRRVPRGELNLEAGSEHDS